MNRRAEEIHSVTVIMFAFYCHALNIRRFLYAGVAATHKAIHGKPRRDRVLIRRSGRSRKDEICSSIQMMSEGRPRVTKNIFYTLL